MQGKEQDNQTAAETTNLVHLKAHAAAKKPSATPTKRNAPFAAISLALMLMLGMAAGGAWWFFSKCSCPSQHHMHACFLARPAAEQGA